MRILQILLLTVLLSVSASAAVITSTATGAWDTNATWDGGAKPANGDSVVIAGGHTVTFDADLSGDGIDLAGLTITGTLTADTMAGDYTLKCSADITGAGTFNIGSSVADYPATCTFTIDFDTTASSIDGTAGLTCNFYCVNPTNPVIELTAIEAIGQTELGVTTDVTGDTWAVGDIVNINNIDLGVDSETRIIAAGGISAGHIDITAGLTAEKLTGSRVILITRNIKITGSTLYAFNHLDCSNLGCEVSDCSYGFYYCNSNTISGVISSCDRALRYCGSNFIPGVISGCEYALRYSVGNIISGTISGCTYALFYSYSNITNGVISGCDYVAYYSSSNTYCGVVNGCTYMLRFCYQDTLYGVAIAAVTTENLGYNDTGGYPSDYTPSYDHDATVGSFKSWTRGGITLSEDTTVPSGYTQAYKMTCENADNACFHQEEVSLEPGETLEVDGQIKFADSHAAYLPRLELINPGADPLWGSGETPLDTDSVASGTSTAWQAVSVSYTNATALAKPILIRTLGKRASGDVYFGWAINKDMPAVGDVEEGVSFDFGSTGTLWSEVPGFAPRRTRYGDTFWGP